MKIPRIDYYAINFLDWLLERKRLELILNVIITAILVYTVFIQADKINNLESQIRGIKVYLAILSMEGIDTTIDEEWLEEEPYGEKW
jgi:hypothetical protein